MIWTVGVGFVSWPLLGLGVLGFSIGKEVSLQRGLWEREFEEFA